VPTLLDTRIATGRRLRCPTVPQVSSDLDAGNAPLDEFETHRRELTAYCYRMLGSGFEAEDAVQETMVRAWKNFDRFEGRSAVRSWLYRIATNVCLDMLQGPQRRARPMDLGPASSASTPLQPGIAEHNWVMPVHDERVLSDNGDPAEVAASRESIRLAFVAALQHLPAKQRAVLILREVLRWQASEVAELLGTSVASVNSALQRARSTLDTVNVDAMTPLQVDDEQRALLERYVDAFERYDITSLVSLLHEDATFTMPPFALWLQGTDDIAQWYVGQGSGCEGSRLVATSANGCPAFASYKPTAPGVWEPFNLHIVEISGGRISGLHHFLYPELYSLFGLPSRLDG
jgi:RNA polymerase sigma-70 factor (ECF subfamily)